MSSQFTLGSTVKLTEDFDLFADCHGAMGIPAHRLMAGATGTVTAVDHDMIEVTLPEIIPYPADFGGPSPTVWAFDPTVASGLSWDLLEIVT